MSEIFDFYNDLDALKRRDWQIKRDFKHRIAHPFWTSSCDLSIEEIYRFAEVTLSICTLWKGVPHGLAVIKHESDDDYFSFNGVGVFNHGKLHNTPLICVNGDGMGWTFSKMENGRPSDGSYMTCFTNNEETHNVDSLET